jgi:gamma-glutamylcyclotransferase (GGCT)/AIG2-like uncharacterized protein YtfP
MEITGFDMYDLDFYPAVINGLGSISGEIYEISKSDEANLDRLEVVPSLYRKETIQTNVGECLIYVYNRSLNDYNCIFDGIWNKNKYYENY